MTASKFLAVAALAVLASTGAQADEAEGSQFVLKVTSTRNRAEVHAEAVAAAKVISTVPAASRAFVVPPSKLERDAVRAEAARALRRGQISRGEADFI